MKFAIQFPFLNGKFHFYLQYFVLSRTRDMQPQEQQPLTQKSSCDASRVKAENWILLRKLATTTNLDDDWEAVANRLAWDFQKMLISDPDNLRTRFEKNYWSFRTVRGLPALITAIERLY